MKNKKAKKAIKVYGLIGKTLCACAGGIVGGILAGPVLAVFGAIAGATGGHFFEKGVLNNAA